MITVTIEFTDEAAARTGIAVVERKYVREAIGTVAAAVSDLSSLALRDGLSQDDIYTVTVR